MAKLELGQTESGSPTDLKVGLGGWVGWLVGETDLQIGKRKNKIGCINLSAEQKHPNQTFFDGRKNLVQREGANSSVH